MMNSKRFYATKRCYRYIQHLCNNNSGNCYLSTDRIRFRVPFRADYMDSLTTGIVLERNIKISIQYIKITKSIRKLIRDDNHTRNTSFQYTRQ